MSALSDDFAQRSLSIVIPMYNEAPVIVDSVTELGRHVDLKSVELILVDDGSTDGTADVARRLASDLAWCRVIELPKNSGKGAAVRAGVAETTGAVVVFMDADMSTSLECLAPALANLEVYDVVIGSRSVAGAVVERSSPTRVVMGRSFNLAMRSLTGLPIHDSQCGFKAFRGDVARWVFALAECDRFAFDPEVLRLAHGFGYTISEVPVVWTAGDRSSVRPVRDSIRTGTDLVRVRWSTRRSRLIRRTRQLVPADVAANEVASVLGT